MFNLFRRKKSKTDDYEQYIIQEKIKSRWNDIDDCDKFMEQRTAVATYAQDYDKTLRLIGMTTVAGKERRDVLWTHWAIKDIEEEEEKRDKKKGSGDFLDTVLQMKELGLIKTGNDMDTLTLVKELRSAEERGEVRMIKLRELAGQSDAEAAKYQFYSNLGKDVKDGLIEGAHIFKGDEEEDNTSQKLLPSGKEKPEEFDPNASKEVPAFVAVLLKYQGAGALPASFLDMLKVMYPAQYNDVLKTEKDELIKFVGKYAEITEELKAWIDGIYET